MRRLGPIFLFVPTLAFAQWPTHRGNVERTGNADGHAGPTQPKVIWVHRSQEHFVAAPAVDGKRVLLSGLGAFNTSSLRAFAPDRQPERQIVWSKTTPY